MADENKTTGTAGAAPAAASQEPASRRVPEGRAKKNDARTDASQRVEDENAARHKANMEAEERRNNSQPTPTQQENDLAKLGHSVDEKEDDGSGPEEPVHGRRSAGSYTTRDLAK